MLNAFVAVWCLRLRPCSVRIMGKEEQALTISPEDITHIRKLGKRKDIFGATPAASPRLPPPALPPPRHTPVRRAPSRCFTGPPRRCTELSVPSGVECGCPRPLVPTPQS
jgi:hypothetical protein